MLAPLEARGLCSPTVLRLRRCDAGPALNQHWFNVLRLTEELPVGLKYIVNAHSPSASRQMLVQNVKLIHQWWIL